MCITIAASIPDMMFLRRKIQNFTLLMGTEASMEFFDSFSFPFFSSYIFPSLLHTHTNSSVKYTPLYI
jgi:hypothetical protein